MVQTNGRARLSEAAIAKWLVVRTAEPSSNAISRPHCDQRLLLLLCLPSTGSHKALVLLTQDNSLLAIKKVFFSVARCEQES